MMQKSRQRNRRGTVLLLVVGLLTIVYMLLGTFLVVTRYDQREARSLAQEGQTEPGAIGIVDMVKARLADDLYFDASDPNSEPYEAIADRADAWKKYIDYPSEESDPHLASALEEEDTGTNEKWRHLTKLDQSILSSHVKNVDWDTTNTAYLDTDGDDKPDAMYFDTGMVDPKGRKIWAWVRVLDTSGFINAGIANDSHSLYGGAGVTGNWQRTDANTNATEWEIAGPYRNPLATTPADIPIGRIVGSTRHGVLNEYRHNFSSMIDTPRFWRDYAGHPYNPEGISPPPGVVYRPFGAGEEAFLRYTGPRELDTGLLARVLNYNEPNRTARKRLLTTASTSRPLLRKPENNRTKRIRITQNWQPSQNEMNWLWEQLVEAGAPEKAAAHFLANLVAHTWYDNPGRGNDDLDKQTFGYSPAGETWTVYGAIEQLVVTDLFVYYEPPTSAGGPDEGWGIAIELMNASWRDVDVTDYEMEGFDFKDLDSGDVIIPPGKRIVLWSAGGKVDKTSGAGEDADDEYFNFPKNPAGDLVYVEEVSELDDLALNNATLKITRKINGKDIPVDKVSSSDAGYSKPASGGNAEIAQGLRDDNWDDYDPASNKWGGRARALIASFATNEPTGPEEHKIGQPNNLAESAVTSYQGFRLHRLGGVPFNLGEMAGIFMTGPDDSGNDLPHQLKGYATDPSRGYMDFRQAPSAGSGDYPTVGWPIIAAELLELLPGDDTRENDEQRRIYGRVNVNTAPRRVLAALPWPDEILDGTINITQSDREKIAEFIQAYRDGQSVEGLDYSNRAGATGITDLRDGVNYDGFLTPAEIAIPLGDFVAWKLGGNYANAVKQARFAGMFGRDALYRAVSNLITVRSDTYAVLITLQTEPGQESMRTWRYLALLDRSNSAAPGDMPVTLLFTKLD